MIPEAVKYMIFNLGINILYKYNINVLFIYFYRSYLPWYYILTLSLKHNNIIILPEAEKILQLI